MQGSKAWPFPVTSLSFMWSTPHNALWSKCHSTIRKTLQYLLTVTMKYELGLAFRPLQCRVKHLQPHCLWFLNEWNFCFIQSLRVPWTYHVHSLFVSSLMQFPLPDFTSPFLCFKKTYLLPSKAQFKVMLWGLFYQACPRYFSPWSSLPPLNFCSTHSAQHPYLTLSIDYLAICSSTSLYICGYT